MSATSYDALIRAAGQRHGVDPALIKAIIAHETGGSFDPRSFRPEPGDLVGSIGLMQILPSTARGVGYSGPVGDRASLTGLWAPEANIEAGVKYLKGMLNQAKGNAAGAASAYNGGWRPQIGFGLPTTKAVTVCLARDPAGKCIQSRDVPVGQYANKDYVEDVLRRYAVYRNEMAPVSGGGGGGGGGGGATTSRLVEFRPSLIGLLVLSVLGLIAAVKRRRRVRPA